MAQQECKVKVPVKGEEKNKENKMLTKLMKYLQENNSRKFVSELNKMLEKEDFERVLNSQINNTYLIVEAAKNNHLNIVTQLVQKQHVNVSYTDKDGKSALYWSCYNNNDKMCEYLMHHGADPHIVTLDYKETPLWQAAYFGNLKIVKYLFNEEKKFVYSFDWVCHITHIITLASFLFSFFFIIDFVCLILHICIVTYFA